MNGAGHLVTCPSVTVTFRNTYCAPQFRGDMEPHRRVIASRNKRNLSLTGTIKLHQFRFPLQSLSPAPIFWKLISNKQEIPCHYLSQDPSPLTKGKVYEITPTVDTWTPVAKPGVKFSKAPALPKLLNSLRCEEQQGCSCLPHLVLLTASSPACCLGTRAGAVVEEL